MIQHASVSSRVHIDFEYTTADEMEVRGIISTTEPDIPSIITEWFEIDRAFPTDGGFAKIIEIARAFP